jgi:hypothetical protein
MSLNLSELQELQELQNLVPDLGPDTILELPPLPPLIRNNYLYDHTAFRERTTGEKYFRQAIFVYNEKGQLVDSGFVQINDYTNMCKMVKVCNKSKKYFHFYERWEHYDNEFYKTDEYSIVDLVTGNNVGTTKATTVLQLIDIINQTTDNACCIVGDLEKDTYSEVLLKYLTEYSEINAPKYTQLYSSMLHNDESAQLNSEEMKVKAQAEIEEVITAQDKIVSRI